MILRPHAPPTGTRRDLSSHPYSDVTPKPGLNFLSAVDLSFAKISVPERPDTDLYGHRGRR